MIEKLQIQDFRGFSDLTLEGLKRVNLVVGRNNSGKTSLLEAIGLACDPQSWQSIIKRQGAADWLVRRGMDIAELARWNVSDSIELRVLLADLQRIPQQKLLSRLGPDQSRLAKAKTHPKPFASYQNLGIYTIERHYLKLEFVPSATAHTFDHVQLFSDATVKRDGEAKIEEALGQIDPRIRRVRLVKEGDENSIVIDIGLDELIPLNQVGQGIMNILTYISLIIGKSPDVCIIDEIENGIHYSALPTFWKGIAAIAETTGTQIFATTHSWECIEAAHEAFSAASTYDFSIIQLFRVEEGPQGRVLDRDHIEAAIKGEIELR